MIYSPAVRLACLLSVLWVSCSGISPPRSKVLSASGMRASISSRAAYRRPEYRPNYAATSIWRERCTGRPSSLPARRKGFRRHH